MTSPSHWLQPTQADNLPLGFEGSTLLFSNSALQNQGDRGDVPRQIASLVWAQNPWVLALPCHQRVTCPSVFGSVPSDLWAPLFACEREVLGYLHSSSFQAQCIEIPQILFWYLWMSANIFKDIYFFQALYPGNESSFGTNVKYKVYFKISATLWLTETIRPSLM